MNIRKLASKQHHRSKVQAGRKNSHKNPLAVSKGKRQPTKRVHARG